MEAPRPPRTLAYMMIAERADFNATVKQAQTGHFLSLTFDAPALFVEQPPSWVNEGGVDLD